MKVLLNNQEYRLADGGYSEHNNNLNLIIVGSQEDISRLENISDKYPIIITNDDGDCVQIYNGYDEVVSCVTKPNCIIKPAKYAKDSTLISEEERATVILLTLKYSLAYINPHAPTPVKTVSVDDLVRELEEANAKIDYLMMLME